MKQLPIAKHSDKNRKKVRLSGRVVGYYLNIDLCRDERTEGKKKKKVKWV